MKVLIKVLLSSFIVLAMMVSLNVSAEEKAKKPAVAVEIAVSKGDEALAVLKSGASAEEVIKLIKETSEATGEIFSNYKTDKARDTAIIHLKAVRTKLKEGQTVEAQEGLEKAIKEIQDLKNTI
ncbi:MAG: hypothetical protein RLZZ66_402 [Pseudomonadota bacterium]|jgi:hypothetical protein